MTKYLVTSALPYANGDIHIGHLVEYIQTDIFVRFLKLKGENAIYMCASDTHGTPIEVNARKQGIAPEDMVARYNKEHHEDFKKFGIHFDKFYTTHSEENRKHVENIFLKLKEADLVYVKDVEQYYCEYDKRFLPDRFVRGLCPKCGAQDQYGDSCEKCGATYDPTDLKDAKCVLCGNPPERRVSKHYFVDLEKAKPVIKKWVDTEGHLHTEMKSWLNTNFLKNPLHSWDISRDAPYFGFKIPGEENKFFYVWMDAPVGYIGTTEKYCSENGLDFNSYWAPDSDTEIVHVIGKDIIYFHTLFWPAMLAYGGYKLPSRIQIHGFLTVNGEKMSKSRGTSIKAGTYAKYLDPQYLRFYYASKLNSGVDDLDLNLEEFRLRVNAELVNKIVNLASRSASLLTKRLEGRTGKPASDFEHVLSEALSKVDEISEYYTKFETGKALREIIRLAESANKYLQDTEPFKLVKTDPERARAIITSILGMVKGLSILLGPVLPEMKTKIEHMLQAEHEWTWKDLDFKVPEITIGKFERLAERVDEAGINAMIEETKQIYEEEQAVQSFETPPFKDFIEFDDFEKLDLRIGEIIEAESVKKAKKLLRITVDLGSEKRNVFAGIKEYFEPETLLGKRVLVVANLKPRKMRFGVSEAMILAAEDSAGNLALLEPSLKSSNSKGMPYPGSLVS